jgi:hypothetical protein
VAIFLSSPGLGLGIGVGDGMDGAWDVLRSNRDRFSADGIATVAGHYGTAIGPGRC